MNRKNPVPCSSCGRSAEWLITLIHRPEKTGRILAYCSACRDGHPSVLVSIPLEAVHDDLFVALYALSYTTSDPRIATEIVFGEERLDLVEQVRGYLPYDP